MDYRGFLKRTREFWYPSDPTNSGRSEKTKRNKMFRILISILLSEQALENNQLMLFLARCRVHLGGYHLSLPFFKALPCLSTHRTHMAPCETPSTPGSFTSSHQTWLRGDHGKKIMWFRALCNDKNRTEYEIFLANWMGGKVQLPFRLKG